MVQYHYSNADYQLPCCFYFEFGINEIVVLAKNNLSKPRRHLLNNGHQVCPWLALFFWSQPLSLFIGETAGLI